MSDILNAVKVLSLLFRLGSIIKKYKLEERIKDLETIVNNLEKDQTPEQIQNTANSIAQFIHGMQPRSDS